jgi:predicted negative regulator of RcsB-dependent stress response
MEPSSYLILLGVILSVVILVFWLKPEQKTQTITQSEPSAYEKHMEECEKKAKSREPEVKAKIQAVTNKTTPIKKKTLRIAVKVSDLKDPNKSSEQRKAEEFMIKQLEKEGKM